MALEHIRIETGRFQAKGGDGLTYTVVELTHYLRTTKFAGDPSPGIVEGLQVMDAWPSGDLVLEVDGKLAIAARGVILERL
ncbi:MAG: hypothetical protein K2Y51_24445 [Gammaproteobacteria bacterium]|nr:hypothetical protein [Gammaproteobacteria bacterium]